MPLSNPSQVTFATSTTSANTTVTATLTPGTLVGANATRKGLTVWNNSTANLYLDFGANPSTTSYAVKVNSNGYYELPFSYIGTINGVWDAANGSAFIRELT